MLPRVNRITKANDYRLLKKEGNVINSDFITLIYKKSNFKIPRFGIIVSNKVSKKAVNRNASKRMIRRIVGLVLPNIKIMDYLIIVRKDLRNEQEEGVEDKVSKLFRKV